MEPFSPLWEAVKEHQSTKIPVQVIRPPWCTKFLLPGTNFALSDRVNPSKASVSYLLCSYLVDFFSCGPLLIILIYGEYYWSKTGAL